LLFGIPSTLHESSIHTPKVLIGREVQAEAAREDESVDRCQCLWNLFLPIAIIQTFTDGADVTSIITGFES